MRLLHIMAGRGQGGAETYATDIMLSLHKEGIDQCIVMPKDAPRFAELQAAGLRMEPDVLRFRLGLIMRWKMARLLAKEKPDIVHCWMRRAASIMPRCRVWRSSPVIGWFGGYYNPDNFKNCTHFVGVTRDIVMHMLAKGVPSDKAFYIPTFPDVRDEPPVDRASLDTKPEAKVVLALSRLHKKKGLDILIRAAKDLPQVVLWLAGEGPLRDELEKLVQDLDMKDRVRFLGWRTDRGALLRAADICCLPSRYEPFGTVILEAWAAKTPFVACRSAGPSACVDHGLNGLLTPIDDVEALRSALTQTLTEDHLREKMIEQGYATYLKAYTREAVTAQMIALYKKLIAEWFEKKIAA